MTGRSRLDARAGVLALTFAFLLAFAPMAAAKPAGGGGGGGGGKPAKDVTAPSAPSALAATAGDAVVDLSWTAASDDRGVTGYRVYRLAGDGAWQAVATTPALSWSATGLSPDVPATHRVTAYDKAGNESPPSDSATATPFLTIETFHLSGTGSDDADGSRDTPWRSISRAFVAAGPGDTVVLHEGDHGALGTRTDVATNGLPGAPVTFAGADGEAPPRLLGAVRVLGDHVRLTGILFDGPTGAIYAPTNANPLGEEVQVAIYGDDVELSDSEVRGNLWHAGIYLSEAYGARIVDNHVHHNGNVARSEEANLDHGIYFGSGSGLVANNVIEHNYAYGVQLYPRPGQVLVEHNTIVRNGRGGVIVASSASNNRLVNNVITGNGLTSVRSSSLKGTGNVVDTNIVWDNGSALGTLADGLVLLANLELDPMLEALWHLSPGSPAIDTANPLWTLGEDRLGRQRPRGGGPDIGAFEDG